MELSGSSIPAGQSFPTDSIPVRDLPGESTKGGTGAIRPYNIAEKMLSFMANNRHKIPTRGSVIESGQADGTAVWLSQTTTRFPKPFPL